MLDYQSVRINMSKILLAEDISFEIRRLEDLKKTQYQYVLSHSAIVWDHVNQKFTPQKSNIDTKNCHF